jgi:hypothetical protein
MFAVNFNKTMHIFNGKEALMDHLKSIRQFHYWFCSHYGRITERALVIDARITIENQLYRG